MLNLNKKPDLIYRDNEPVAVILGIEDYENILEILEERQDIEDSNEALLNNEERIEFKAENYV
ncbi:MAG: hypothetical protein GX121_06060 [Ignavibacteria bacterium]|nr:hypothetical protein [Ignavibacteria bacterium]